MKKQFFSKGLYLEGLRQLKLIGILISVILSIIAILPPVGIGIITLKNLPQDEILIPTPINGAQMNPAILIVFLLVAPIMALSLFGFLNKRKASDFYHAIPHTRLSVFLSFYAAIMTWVIITILSSSLCAAVSYAVFPSVYTPQYLGLLLYMLTCFIISILTVGGTLIAISVSGTISINVILAVLILYLPRIAVSVLNYSLLSSVPILSAGHNFPLLESDYNLLISFFIQIYKNNFTVEDLSNVHGLIYTAVLGLIYTILAAILFIRRKSESSEQSAPSKRLQATYRIIITMFICLFACAFLFSAICLKDTNTDDNILGIVVLYILSLIVYFAYELITTRKWKNLLKALPGLGIVICINVAMLGLLGGLRAYHLSFRPSADEIKYISVVNNYSGYYEPTFYDYIYSRIGTIKLDTPESKEIVANALSKNIDALKEYGPKYNYYSYAHTEVVPMTFKIETSSGSRYRTIYVTEEQKNLISTQLAEDQQYRDLFMNLPKPSVSYGGFGSIYIFGNIGTYTDLSSEQEKALVDTLQNEITSLGFEKWFECVSNTQYYQYTYISYLVDDIGRISVYINPTDLPKTYKLYLEYAANSDPSESLLRLEESADKSDFWIDTTFRVYLSNPDTDELRVFYFNYSYYYNDFDGNEITATQEYYSNIITYLCSKIHDGGYKSADSFLELTLGSSNGDYYGDYYGAYYYDYINDIVFLSGVTEEELLALGFTEETQEASVDIEGIKLTVD